MNESRRSSNNHSEGWFMRIFKCGDVFLVKAAGSVKMEEDQADSHYLLILYDVNGSCDMGKKEYGTNHD